MKNWNEDWAEWERCLCVVDVLKANVVGEYHFEIGPGETGFSESCVVQPTAVNFEVLVIVLR